MSWITLVRNPKAIAHLYDEVPPLNGMEVLRVHLDRDGPTLTLDMDFPQFVDHLPTRWEKQSNSIQVVLRFDDIRDFQMTGFSINPVFDFSIRQISDGLLVAAGDSNCKISFRCENIYIQKVTGYTKRLE
jgi:hypothetical protein